MAEVITAQGPRPRRDTKRLTELTPADVEDIYGLWGFGYTMTEIARAYDVSQSTVSAIINRHRYQDAELQQTVDDFSVAVTGRTSLGTL